MDCTVFPADLQAGDRLVDLDPEDTWAQVAKVGKTVNDKHLGKGVQVYLKGQDEPRLMAVMSHIPIRRDDAAPVPDYVRERLTPSPPAD